MNRSSESFDWTAARIARLSTLWNDGLSTTDIGRQLGVSKNAVVGKAHRRGLQPRLNPVRRPQEAPAQPGSPRPHSKPTPKVAPSLPALPSQVNRPRPETAQTPQIRPSQLSEKNRVATPQNPPPRTEPPSLRLATVHACCWPIGEPGTQLFRFCDAIATDKTPYCATHAARAYIRRPLADAALSSSTNQKGY